MTNVALMNLAANAVKARSVSQTSNGYVSKIATLTEPRGDAGDATGASVIDLCDRGGYSQTKVKIIPYGAGADNGTFSLRLIGWQPFGTTQTDLIWLPVPIAELTCTLSAAVGVAGGALVATDRLCDTIVVAGTRGSLQPRVTNDNGTAAEFGGTVTATSPANDTIAFAVAFLWGFPKLEVSFTTGGSATNCNALLAFF
jgi:hypothetical protein